MWGEKKKKMLSFLCCFSSVLISCTRYIQNLRRDRGLSFWRDCLSSLSNGTQGTSVLSAKQALLWKASGNTIVVSIYESEDQQWNPTDEQHKKSWIRPYKPINHSKLKCHETQSISGKAFPYRLLKKTKPSAYSKINLDEFKLNRIVLHEITRTALRCCRAVFCKWLSSGWWDSVWKLWMYHHQRGSKIII